MRILSSRDPTGTIAISFSAATALASAASASFSAATATLSITPKSIIGIPGGNVPFRASCAQRAITAAPCDPGGGNG